MIAGITKVNNTTVHINFKKAGTVWLYALVNNCVVKDSFKITVRTPAKNVSINKDSLLCPGKNILLQATPGFAEYKWQDGSILDRFVVRKAGFYKLVATDGCGVIFADSVTIQLVDTTFAMASPKVICIGDTATLTLPMFAGNVSWQPFDNAFLSNSVLYLYPLQTTTYIIRAIKNPGCALESTMKIIVNNCPETIFFPNSFTPNNDRLNDIFKPTVSLPLKSYNLSIYNSYGQLVFTTNTPDMGWNGSYRQEQQKSGNYIYKCTYQFKRGTVKFKKGNCLLLR
jgi:gliding motility-associated-like protein